MSSRLGIAIIGSGIFVRDEHLSAVQASSELELKAIFSRTLKSAKAVSEGLAGVDLYSQDSDRSYANLLAREDVQTVIVALPIPVQPEYIKQALAAGKHVLAEKPIAKDVATASELIAWYNQKIDTSKVHLGIAENYRHIGVFDKVAQQVAQFGKIQAFNTSVHFFLRPEEKHTQTEWRKDPQFQGGFLLDAGVHIVAVLRRVLSGGGSGAKIKTASAFVSSNQPHLPPVDTIAATLQLENGATGTFSLSFGSTFFDGDYTVACEGGTVAGNVFTSQLTVRPFGGEEVVTSASDEKGWVSQEVAAWAKSIINWKVDQSLRPEEALADVEVIEAMLTSRGNAITLKHQI